MNTQKLLITYESQFESTKEIAEFMAESLIHEYQVDIMEVSSVNEIHHYDCFIIGSAIQYDSWMPQSRKFVINNEELLSQKQVAYYFSCLVLSHNNDNARKQAEGYSNKIKALAPKINVKSIGTFAGKLDYSKIPFYLRFIARIVLTILRVKERDYRNWDVIKDWVNGIPFQ